MMRQMCRAKIHRPKVTEANLDYEGSITIDQDLLDAADIAEYEKVQVVDVNNGNRFETYVISGKSGTGTICLNGGAARMGNVGDLLIVISYGCVDETQLKGFKPRIVLVDDRNRIKQLI